MALIQQSKYQCFNAYTLLMHTSSEQFLLVDIAAAVQYLLRIAVLPYEFQQCKYQIIELLHISLM